MSRWILSWLVLAGGCTSTPTPVERPDGSVEDMLPPDGSPDTLWTMPPRGRCDSNYGIGVTGTEVADEDLRETSGIVPSPSRAGLLWMHNDSGDEAKLYAIGVDGAARGRLILPVNATDWEDIAAAPCPDRSGPCLWVGDIGDNAAAREQISVYAVPEPQTDGQHQASRVWHFPVRYPNGSRDAEALVVSPAGDAFWLFEKDEDGRVSTYHHPGPLVDGVETVLEKSKKFDAPGVDIERGRMITAADLHPSGTRLLLRVYTGIYEYRFGAGQGPMDLDDVTPELVTFGPLSEPQGEAVAYDETGTGILSISEDPEQAPGQPVHHYPCQGE